MFASVSRSRLLNMQAGGLSRQTQRLVRWSSSSAGGAPNMKGPVSWRSLFLAGVAAATAVAYYQVERERRLEQAMGKIVSSESEGWTPRPDYLAKRKFVPTKWGWFPEKDGFGARECWVATNTSLEGRDFTCDKNCISSFHWLLLFSLNTQLVNLPSEGLGL